MIKFMQGDEVVHIVATAALSHYSQNIRSHGHFMVSCQTVLWRVRRKWRQLLLTHLRESKFIRVLMIRRVKNALALPSSRSKLFIIDGEWGLASYLLDTSSDLILLIGLRISPNKCTSQSRAHVLVCMASHIF